MSCTTGISEELLLAASANGPERTDPPYVRAPFPTLALPDVLRTFVEQAAEAIGVPVECVATPALATCAAAIGNTCRVKLTTEWNEPAVLWAVTLMESGSLKTPAYKAAVEPLRVAQRLAQKSFAEKQAAYKKARADHEADAAFWNRQVGDDRPAEPPPEPVEPKPTDYYTSDSTVEALAILFNNNPRGLALTRDELSGFFASFGAYKGGRGGDESAYLETFGAGEIKLDRASGKKIFAPAAALSIFGTCQPTVFLNAIGALGRGANQVDNGLASRFIIAAPEPEVKRWRKPRPLRSADYARLIADLLMIPLPLDADGWAAPNVIDLHPDAEKYFALFVNEHGKQRADLQNRALRFHYAKLEAIAARLALIFYLCDSATHQITAEPRVQARHVVAGIALARWYGFEAQRVYEGYESDAERAQRELLEDIRACGGSITLAEMGRGRRRWRDPHAAEMALRALDRAGLGKLALESPGPEGGRPRLRFRLFEDGERWGAGLTSEKPGIPVAIPPEP